MRLLVLVACVAALIGGLTGALTVALLSKDADLQRGAVVRLGGNSSTIEETPFCVEAQRFCLVLLDSGEHRALYTYDTHPWFRTWGCQIRWRDDFPFVDPAKGEESLGWFRGDCSGSTFRYSGERVFGPTARDMDQFPVTRKTEDGSEFLEVDTRRLICGTLHTAGHPPGCEFAPLPQ